MNDIQAYVVNGHFVAFGKKEDINKLAIAEFIRYINILKVDTAIKEIATGEQR